MPLALHLRELWRQRTGVAVSFVLALLAAALSTNQIGLFPPRLEARKLQISAASTRVLVDGRPSRLVDLGVDVNSFKSLSQIANGLGQIMATPGVRPYIAKRAGLRADQIATTAPVTVSVPRVVTEPDSERRASDLLSSADQYRLEIQVSPDVPILDINTEAPSPEEAKRLANAAVLGLDDFLKTKGLDAGLPEARLVRLEQLGEPRAGVINAGASVQVALLSFLVVFAIACATVLFVSRLRRGLREAAAAEQRAARRPVRPRTGDAA